ncbi:MAG: hypothetical protein ACR2ML_11905 [Solirubrobacteraceae bacterium]
MKALRFATVPFALALLLATAGCELEEPSGRDKQDVVKQTSAACRALDLKLAKLIRPVELEELAIFYEVVAGDIDTMLKKLDAFEPPSADLPDWNEFLGGIHQQRDLTREAADAAVDKRAGKVSGAEGELRLAHERTNLAGRKYGVDTTCVNLPT